MFLHSVVVYSLVSNQDHNKVYLYRSCPGGGFMVWDKINIWFSLQSKSWLSVYIYKHSMPQPWYWCSALFSNASIYDYKTCHYTMFFNAPNHNLETDILPCCPILQLTTIKSVIALCCPMLLITTTVPPSRYPAIHHPTMLCKALPTTTYVVSLCNVVQSVNQPEYRYLMECISSSSSLAANNFETKRGQRTNHADWNLSYILD